MDVAFDNLGFDIRYRCEVNPEFPGTGIWSCPEYYYWREPAAHSAEGAFHSRWGPPLVVLVAPEERDDWVGFFEAGGFGTFTGVYGLASPHQLLAVNGGFGYLLNVESPEQADVLTTEPIIDVRRVDGTEIVLLVSFSELAALDGQGLAWISGRLCLDDLRVSEADERCVRLVGMFLEGEGEFLVDPRTGAVIGARPFYEVYPQLAGRSPWRRAD